MTGEYTLRSVLSNLDGDKQKDRTSSLDSLRLFLEDKQVVQNLSAGTWKSILEKFCALVTKEKGIQLSKAHSQTTPKSYRAPAISLSQLAKDFRWLCELGHESLDEAWIRPILEHILQVLPYQGGLFKPFAIHYTRALRGILSHRSYRDHLSLHGWDELVNLCAQILSGDGSGGDDRYSADSKDDFAGSSQTSQSHYNSPEVIEIARIFAILVTCCPKDLSRSAETIFQTLSSFFVQNEKENGCHYPLLSALNFMVYELSANCGDMVWQFLNTVMPCLFPLWKARSPIQLKPELININRFFMRSWMSRKSGSSKNWEERADWKYFVSQVYEAVMREIKSNKSTIKCMVSTEVFMESVRIKASQPMSLLSQMTETSSHLQEDVDKDLIPWTFLDMASDCIYDVLSDESAASHTAMDDIDEVKEDSERYVGTPRPKKKQKRSDVCTDIRQALACDNRKERLSMIQIVAFLFEKYGRSIATDHCAELFGAVCELVVTEDNEKQRWAFVCLAACARSGCITMEIYAESWLMVWDAACRRVAAGGIGVDGGFYLLEAIVSGRLIPERILLKSSADLIAGITESGVSVSISAISFLSSVLNLEAEVYVEHASDEAVQWGNVLKWAWSTHLDRGLISILDEENAARKEEIPPTPHVLAQFTANMCLSDSRFECATSTTFGITHVYPVNTRAKEEYLNEWKLETTEELCWRIVNQDLSVLSGVKNGRHQISDSSPWSARSHIPSEQHVLDVLTEFVKRVRGPADTGKSPVHSNAMKGHFVGDGSTLLAKVYSLAAVIKTVRLFAVSHTAFKELYDQSPLLHHVTKLMEVVGKGVAENILITRAFSLCLETLSGLLDSDCILQVMKVDANLKERTSLNDSNMESVAKPIDSLGIWPLRVKDLVVLLESAMLSLNPEPIAKTKDHHAGLTKRAAPFDDFGARAISGGTTKGQSNAWVASPYMDYFCAWGDIEALQTRCKVLGIRLVVSIYESLVKQAGSENLTSEIVRFMSALMAGEITPFLTIQEEILKFLRAATNELSVDQCLQMLEINRKLLLLYKYQKNIWAWIYSIRALGALLPTILYAKENSEIKSIISQMLRFFNKRLKTQNLPWRVCQELGGFLIQYLKVEPEQKYLQDQLILPEKEDLPLVVAMKLLIHEDISVRLFIARSLPEMFTVFIAEDHGDMLSDIHAILDSGEKTKSRVLTDALTYAEIAVVSPSQRLTCITRLFDLAALPDNFQLAESALDSISYRLTSMNHVDFLVAMLEKVVYAFDGAMETFPVRLLGCDSFEEFIDRHAEAVLPRMMMRGEFVASSILQDKGRHTEKLLKRVFPFVLAYLLPFCNPDQSKAKNTAQARDQKRAAEAAISFVKERLGDDAFNLELSKGYTIIITCFLELTYDAVDPVEEVVNEYEFAEIEHSIRQIRDRDTETSSSFIGSTVQPSFERHRILKAMDSLRILFEGHSSNESSTPASFAAFLKPHRLQAILQRFHEDLEARTFKSDKKRLLENGYALIMAMATPSLRHPYLFRSSMSILLKNMQTAELCHICCNIVRFLCNDVAQSSPEILCANLAAIVPALADIVARYGVDGEAKSAVLGVIDEILRLGQSIDEEAVELTIMQLDSDLFDAIRTKYGVAIGTVDIALAKKMILLKTSTLSTRLATIKYLRKCLEDEALLKQIANDNVTVSMLVRQLLNIARHGDKSDALALEIGRCLGRLSPFVRGRLAPQAGPAESIEENREGETIKERFAGHVLALEYMQRLSLDSDLSIVSAATKTLKTVVSTARGNEVFKELNADVAAHLDIFKGKIPPKNKIIRTKNTYPDARTSSIWSSSSLAADDESIDLWIVTLANSILSSYPTDEFLPNLGLLFELWPAFAEAMLPHIIHSGLLTETQLPGVEKPMSDLLSREFGDFFARSEREHPKAVQTLLAVVEFLRTQPHPDATTPFANNTLWLDLDYVRLAHGAVIVKSYATALLFLEISMEPERLALKKIDSMLLGSSSELGMDIDNIRIPSASQLLQDIYRNIDDSDGFEGVLAFADSDTIVGNQSLLGQKYEHEGAWQKMFNFQETELKARGGVLKAEIGTSIALMKSMHQLGYHHVLDMYARGLGDVTSHMSDTERQEAAELHYESMWRNGQWAYDVEQTHSRKVQDNVINRSLFHCLKAIEHNDNDSLAKQITAAFLAQAKQLQSLKIDVTGNIFMALRPLILFTEIEEMAQIRALHFPNDMNLEVFSLWETRMKGLMNEHRFADTESIFACRLAILKALTAGTVQQTPDQTSIPVHKYLCHHLLTYGQAARKARNLQISQHAFAQLRDIQKGHTFDWGDERDSARAVLQNLKLLWMQGDHTTAIRSLKHYVKPGQTNAKAVNGPLLCQLGKWISQSRSENPTKVLEAYFESAAHAVAGSANAEDRGRVHYHLARYADAQYKEMCENDPLAELSELQRHKQGELDALEAPQATDKTSRASYNHQKRKLELQIGMDKAEARRYLDDRKLFLEKSVENYLRSLEAGEARWEMCVFRLCGLWFANLDQGGINAKIGAYVDRIPSQRFLVLMYQLSARMSTQHPPEEKDFQEVLSALISKVATDHPHHCLYQIIALKNGASSNDSPARSLAQAASQILKKLMANPALSALVANVERLCDAYIELANVRLAKGETNKKRLRFDRKWKLCYIADLVGVPITTVELEISKPGCYDDFPHVVGFKPEVSLVGGINVPKVVSCYGSDGKSYTQLVKGNDDMRQDAVLSKIFSILNILLQKNMETRNRNLAIRTYKVVPLSPRTGLLEWVNNSAPIGEIMVDCHDRHTQGDLTHLECRKKMGEEIARPSSDRSSKVAVYSLIEQKFRPAFRHFFFENYTDPITWFERRLAYVRSVASSSIAGYVVGLGDRHAQNILIDKGTAELIHIDLGIAFDQGKLLSTPEVVPFRLTRNMVDGMGITAVEGAFRRCCEHTLVVLRAESYILETILEVFRYDPLYNWRKSLGKGSRSAVPAGEQGIQRGNKDADRAITGVTKKLSSSLSVEYQVNELIQNAMDPRNLSRMFPGWQPWL